MDRPKITLVETSKKTPKEIADQFDQLHKLSPIGFVAVVAFRGYYLDTMGVPGKNDRGIYDDCMAVIWPGGYLTFNANTDPSRFKPEVATLIPGMHFFKKGKHGITTHADGGYNAFRPATPDESLPVWRDGHGTQIFKGIAINLHKGGYTTTSSEGCQTVHPDQWNEFQTKIYELMTYYRQDKLPYALIDWVQ